MEVFEKEHHPNQALRNFERDGAFWLWVSIGSVFVTYGLLKYFGLNPASKFFPSVVTYISSFASPV